MFCLKEDQIVKDDLEESLLVYGLGIEEFKIFDMQPVAGAAINIGDKCYIGKETEDRTQIDHVRARVNYSDLTHTAQSELSFVLDEIVKDNEEIHPIL